MGKDGRTSAMIERLPAEGAIIIVPRERIAKTLAKMIYETRGPDLEALCRVVTIQTPDDLELLHGLKGQVRFDHTFRDMSSDALWAETRDLVNGIRAASISPTGAA